MLEICVERGWGALAPSFRRKNSQKMVLRIYTPYVSPKKSILSKLKVPPDEQTHGLGIPTIRTAKQELRYSDEIGLRGPVLRKKK